MRMMYISLIGTTRRNIDHLVGHQKLHGRVDFRLQTWESLDRHVKLCWFQIDDHSSDLWSMLFTNKAFNVPVDGSSDNLLPSILSGLHILFRVEHGIDLLLVLNCTRVRSLLLLLLIALVCHLHVHHLLRHHVAHLCLIDRLARHHWHGFIKLPAISIGSVLILSLSLERSVYRLLELLTIGWYMVASLAILVIVHAQLVHDDSQRSDQLK